jgi:hypothetical protein
MLFSILTVSAIEVSDSSLSDAADLKKTVVLGLEFGMPPSSAISTLASMGVKFESSFDGRKVKEPGFDIFAFKGMPKGVDVRQGTMSLVFFQKRLISFDLFFPPTYENFLILKEQLMQSLGPRFKIDEQKEAMDSQLKAYLANLGSRFGDASEAAIKQAILSGDTFFFYRIKDNLGLLNTVLSFSRAQNEDGTSKVELFLHYEDTQGMGLLKNTLDSKKPAGLLPRD